jgi:hypothetical protein
MQEIVQFHVPAALHPGKDFLYEFRIRYENIRLWVLTAVDMKSSITWDVTPCSPLKINRCFQPADSECSSETSIDFQRARRRYIQEYRTTYYGNLQRPKCMHTYIHHVIQTYLTNTEQDGWSFNIWFLFGRHSESRSYLRLSRLRIFVVLLKP